MPTTQATSYQPAWISAIAARIARLPDAQAAEGRVDLDEERAQVALLAIELRGKVADVGDLDLVGLDGGGFERAEHALAHQRGEVLSLLGPVAREVGLVTPEDVDGQVRG